MQLNSVFSNKEPCYSELMGSITWGLIVYFSALVLLLLWGRRPQRNSHPILPFVRVFFPSWKFFEHAENTPVLSCRFQTYSPQEMTQWVDPLVFPPRSALSILLNPQENLTLAYHSMVQRLVSDISEVPSEQIEKGVSFLLVKNLVEEKARSHSDVSGFQFKISINGEDTLISKTYPVGPV